MRRILSRTHGALRVARRACGKGVLRRMSRDYTYICRDCDFLFDEPETIRWTENLDGERGIERWTTVVCPLCGSGNIEEYREEEEEDADCVV